MSQSVAAFKPNYFIIQSLDGSKKIDITNSLLFFDYFEDILSPCITATAQIVNSTSLFNLLPIRGGEKVSISVDTAFGEFLFDGDTAFYVYKVSNLDAQKSSEMFTLHLVSREGLTNDTVRCERKYTGNIQTTVTKILKDVLKTKKFKSENIESTSNEFSFIGNNRKPFHVLTWLGPKAVPANGQNSGTSGGENSGIAKGTAGFLFYENKDGFNFRSIDSLVSSTQIQNNSADKESIYSYQYAPIIESNNVETNFRILNYKYEKNIDLMKALRVGMYANKTYYFDLYSSTLDIYKYTVKDQVKNKLGASKSIAVSEEFGDSISRIMFKASDRGNLNNDGTISGKSRSGADMSMSYSRYNLLFTQALNMVIPCNIRLKVGDIIKAQFPRITRTDNKEADDEQSGNYLIKELRHHFEGNQMVTSVKLIRDSYGLYGPQNE
jgi:hypothetical protein